MVGRTRYRVPLEASLRPKFEALEAVVELRVLGSGHDDSTPPDRTFVLVPPFRPRQLDGILFYLLLPLVVARELRRFGPDAVLAQSPYEGAAALIARRLVRRNAPVVVEVHGDWRTATRLYGSRSRERLSHFADRAASWALGRADAVRTISAYTTGLVRELGVEPAATFPAYLDLDPFLEPVAPLPEHSQALFVGVLEPYKNIDGLVAAWRLAAPQLPGTRLVIVGSGSRRAHVERLVADLPAQTEYRPRLSSREVAAALDDASILVLPSRSEGLGRVVIEALCRGRGVLASRVGGIPDIVEDGVNGVLVPPDDVEALAAALVRVLGDHDLVGRLAEPARASVVSWLASPEDYAASVLELVERAQAAERVAVA
jgi:glycosyltransferase involved in cell wall biosynthesis